MKISKLDLRLFILIFPFFEPWWFTKVGLLDNLYDLTKFAICFLVIYHLVKGQYRIGKIAFIFGLYRLLVCAVTVVRGLNVIGYLSESIQFVCFLVLLQNLLERHGERVLKIVLVSFTLILVANLLTYTPGGIVFEPNSGYYLLSIRTRIAECAIPAIGIGLFYHRLTNKGRALLLCILVSSIAFFVLQWVATALTCVTMFALLLVLERVISRKAVEKYHWFLLLAVVAVSLGVVFFNIQELFANLIETILHKRATLTGRTDLWAIAIPYIKERWLLGYGYQNQGNFVSMYDFTTTSHNQWLQTMYYGGVIGSVIYYSIPLISVKNSITNDFEFNRKSSPLLIALCIVVFMCTTEIVMDNIFYLVLLMVLFNVELFRKGN